MSLTSLLRSDNQIRGLFKMFFDKPRLPPGPDMQAPPKTKNYQMIGTAFDYLLRFEVARLNRDKTDKERRGGWVADSAIDLIRDVELQEEARKMVVTARERRDQYISTGQVTDNLLRSVINLARLDPIFRAGRGHNYIGSEIESGDIEDLRQLLALVPRDQFTAEERCLLNPTFGTGSMLVRGADADLMIDDAIIDVKTTKKWSVRRRMFNQLLGYYTLLQIDKIEHVDPKPKMQRLCIYFSRHGVVHSYQIQDLIGKGDFEEFKEKFETRCEELRPTLPKENESE